MIPSIFDEEDHFRLHIGRGASDNPLMKTRASLHHLLVLILIVILGGCSDQEKAQLLERATNETISQLGKESEHSLSRPVMSDWPHMFGPTGNSRSPETWVDVNWPATGPQMVWEQQVGLGYSCPVIAGGRLVMLHRIDDWELATTYDSETGQLLWETAWPASYQNQYEYSRGTYTTPIIDGDRVYVLGATCDLLCLSLEDGTRIWERDLDADYRPGELPYGFGATPLLEDDRLIINLGGQVGDSGIVAIDKMSGETLWTSTQEAASYCTPVATTVDERRLVLVLSKQNLNCLDPDTGDVFWQEEFGIKNSRERINAVSPMLVGADRVVVTFGPGPGARMYQLYGDGSHSELWSTRRGGLESQYTNLLVNEDSIYGFSYRTSCELRCIDLETGEQRWVWDFDHQLRRSMSIQIGDRYVIALGQEGHLLSLAPNSDGPRLISSMEEPVLSPNCFTQPVLSRGLLYLRNEEQLKCFSLRPKSMESQMLTTKELAP